MAAGDIVNGISSINSGSYLALQPAAGTEWIIHNISFNGAIEIYFYDGSNEILVDSDGAAGARQCMMYHCNNTRYYRVKAISATRLIGYDGIITKQA